MRRIACHRLIPLEDSLNIDRARSRRERGFGPSVRGNSNVAEAMTMAVELELKRISDLLDFKKSPFHLSCCAIAYHSEIPS